MEEHARDAEDSARRGPARRARRPRASTADSGTDSADEAPPPPRPKKKRPRYKSDDPRRNPPPSVANLLADRNASLERAASVSSTASTSTAKVTFYVDETVMGDECLLINGSEEEGVTAYVAQTLACGVCQEPYRRATRPPSGEVVKWPPGSADDEGQVLTPYVSTRSTSKAIKNLRELTSYARFMRKKMRGETRVRFTKVGKPEMLDLLRTLPRHHLERRAVRIANEFEESLGMFVDLKILNPDKTLVNQDDAVDKGGGGGGVGPAADVDEDAPAPSDDDDPAPVGGTDEPAPAAAEAAAEVDDDDAPAAVADDVDGLEELPEDGVAAPAAAPAAAPEMSVGARARERRRREMAAAAAAAPAPATTVIAPHPRPSPRWREVEDPFNVGLGPQDFYGRKIYSAPGLDRLRGLGPWFADIRSGRVTPNPRELWTVFCAAVEEKDGPLHPAMVQRPPSGYGGYAPSRAFPPGGFGYGYGYAPAPPSWPMSFGYVPQQYGAASTAWSAPLEQPPPDAVFETETTVGGRRLDERGGGAPVCPDYVRGQCGAGPACPRRHVRFIAQQTDGSAGAPCAHYPNCRFGSACRFRHYAGPAGPSG